jgi:hypothetical protein
VPSFWYPEKVSSKFSLTCMFRTTPCEFKGNKKTYVRGVVDSDCVAATRSGRRRLSFRV